jgi:NAD(P)-dependent dehydrogenase (short-subunit alcohol dehydrogenase family)
MSSPQTILVTGSSSGFGRCISQTLARQGHRVWATMRQTSGKNAPAAQDLQQWAQAEHLALQVLDLDVCDDASVQGVVQTAIAEAGGLDVVINNAGVMAIGLAEALTVAQVQHMYEVNVLGALRVTQAVLPHWRAQRAGYVLYLSSGGGSVVYPFMGMYGATKAALNAMAETLHYEVYRLGIDTTIVQAGMYATELRANVQIAAIPQVTAAYGEVGTLAQGLVGNFAAALTPGVAGDPQEVADLIAGLIAQPAGQRPLYQAIGPHTEALAGMNDMHLGVQHQVLSGMGMAALLNR